MNKLIASIVFLLILHPSAWAAGQAVADPSCQDLRSADEATLKKVTSETGKGMRSVYNEINRLVDQLVANDKEIQVRQIVLAQAPVMVTRRARRWYVYYKKAVSANKEAIQSDKDYKEEIKTRIAALDKTYAYALKDPQTYYDKIEEYNTKKSGLERRLPIIDARIAGYAKDLAEAEKNAAEVLKNPGQPASLDSDFFKRRMGDLEAKQQRRRELMRRLEALKEDARNWVRRYVCIKALRKNLEASATGNGLQGTWAMRCSGQYITGIRGTFRGRVDDRGTVTGQWTEEDGDTGPITGTVTDGRLVHWTMSYLNDRFDATGDWTAGSGPIQSANVSKQLGVCSGTWSVDK